MAIMKFEDTVTPELSSLSVPSESGSNEFTCGQEGQVIKTNGETIFWGDASNVKEITQEEYDALSDEEKTDGTIYFIKDSSDGEGGLGGAVLQIQQNGKIIAVFSKDSGSVTANIETPQADWAESDETSPTYIKNKQNITTALTKAEFDLLSEEEQNDGTIYLITDEFAMAENVKVDSVSIIKGLGYTPAKKEDVVFYEDSDDDEEVEIADPGTSVKQKIVELETHALYADTTGADRGTSPMTSADLLGGRISADDVEKKKCVVLARSTSMTATTYSV